jgi:hypothetical protein
MILIRKNHTRKYNLLPYRYAAEIAAQQVRRKGRFDSKTLHRLDPIAKSASRRRTSEIQFAQVELASFGAN